MKKNKILIKLLFTLILMISFNKNVKAIEGDQYKCTYDDFDIIIEERTTGMTGYLIKEVLGHENSIYDIDNILTITPYDDCPTFCVKESLTANSYILEKPNSLSVLSECTVGTKAVATGDKVLFKKAEVNNSGNNDTNNNNNNGNSNTNSGNNDTNSGNTNNTNPNKVKDYFKANRSCGGNDYFTFNKNIPRLTSLAYTLLKIAVPIILIIKGMMDMFKAMSAGKEDEMKKAQKKFIQRLIAGICAFLVFIIVETLINWLSNVTDHEGAMSCVNCFINGEEYCEVVETNNNDNNNSVGYFETPFENGVFLIEISTAPLLII